MKLFTAVLTFLATLAVIAMPTSTLSDSDILNKILGNRNGLSFNTRKLLDATTGRRSKRQTTEEIKEALATVLGAIEDAHKPRPASTVPMIRKSSSGAWAGASQVTVRYGPYRVPGISEKNFQTKILGLQGAALNLKLRATKPCEGDCVILNMEAALENEDGKKLDVSNGIFFHHAVVANMGPQVVDAVCQTSVEYFYESGHEGTPIQYGIQNSSVKSGYHIHSTDNFMLGTEFQGLDDKEKWIWLALRYTILDGPHPELKEGKIVFVDIGHDRCTGVAQTNSNLTASMKPATKVFTERAQPWKSRYDGIVLGNAAHMHDAGVEARISVNNQLVCTSAAHYAKDLASGLSGKIDHHYFDNEHILRQDFCVLDPGVLMTKGDELSFSVDYDFESHQGMIDNKGELVAIGAVVGTLFVVDYPVPKVVRGYE